LFSIIGITLPPPDLLFIFLSIDLDELIEGNGEAAGLAGVKLAGCGA
jgi:hypothetical protein